MSKSLVTENPDELYAVAEDEIMKSLDAICNFPPIKTMRDLFSKEHNYEIVGEIVTDHVT